MTGAVSAPIPVPALPPGSTLGILGGGQLGRMLSQAASRLGFNVVILDPEENSPAGRSCRVRGELASRGHVATRRTSQELLRSSGHFCTS